MTANRSLARKFGWLWAAYAVSTFGTYLAFDAFALIAIIVLHAGSTEVSALAAAGLAAGALLAVPLGPWMEHRTCIGVFNPLLATYRLRHSETSRLARTLSARSVTSSATIAAMTALWGQLAGITSLRVAIAIAGALMLASIPLLPRREPKPSCLEGSLATTDRQGNGAEAGAHRLHA